MLKDKVHSWKRKAWKQKEKQNKKRKCVSAERGKAMHPL